MSTKKIIERHHPCEAVVLLVQRMESNPEEFRLDTGKWANLLAHVKKRVVDKNADAFIILDDFEAEMVWNKFKAAGKKELHTFVMKKILEGDEDE
jgi:hypothetical protein